jgi:hypothetical protein
LIRRSIWLLALALSALVPQVYSQAPGLNIQLNGARVNLSITGLVNTTCAVQYTAELAPTNNWQLFTNLVLASNRCVLADLPISAAGQRFYRVSAAHPALTVTDAQLEDMCSRTCDYLTANSKIPETITVGGASTNTVSAAELQYLMATWLRYYQSHAQTPPATVTITGGTEAPPAPSGLESGTIYLADILAAAETSAGFIGTNSTLPNCSTVGAVQYTTKAMFSVFARTINWYQDHAATMPNYATVRAVTAPDSWPQSPPPSGLKVAIFSDPEGGSTDADCIQATISILSTNSGFVPSTISGAAIRAGGLTNYDVVMFPGGGGTGQATALQQTGCAKVAEFVAGGGGYVGTCAGAYLAPLGYNTQTSWLELVDAQVIDVDHWNRGVGLAEIHIVNTNNPIVAGFPEYITARYVNGPLLGPGGSPVLSDYEQDAVFVTDIHDNAAAGIMPGTTCMTRSTYQLGRCVLFSFHPELTAGLEQLDVRAVKWAAGEL